MIKKIAAIILLSLSLAACVDLERQCREDCAGKGYQDERCEALCSSD